MTRLRTSGLARAMEAKISAQSQVLGSLSNVGVRIMKFHNTIFSDIKMALCQMLGCGL